MPRVYHWTFPLPRTHTGMLLGNGVIGAMVWGEGNTLRITVGRADVWDHRGGRQWTEQMNYTNLRRLLEAGDEAAIRAIFARQSKPGEPDEPQMLPLGRVELTTPSPIVRGTLDFDTGVCTVSLADGQTIAVELSMSSPLLYVSPALPLTHVHAWQYVGESLTKVGYHPPRLSGDGWEWDIPGELPVALLTKPSTAGTWITCDRGRAACEKNLASADLDRVRSDNAAWWTDYWRDTPRIDVPDANVKFLLDYGLYKFAGLTHPAGIAATLQGPWCEEYQLPPWSNDYHFNINVQMCYSPAYRAGKLHHLRPLFDLIWSWRERLRDNARKFVGIEDGYVLPHATDDRGQIIGAFWTGTIDHGCTAWIAKMMYDYAVGSGDVAFLRERAYPFMIGAMRVYEAMLERDGEALTLPVSVSPEYRGASMNAWGRDASFQLACIHWLAEKLQIAARTLGETPRPIWAEIARRLPKACVENGEIMLWRGTPLEESHRHHSHLAGLLPFDVIDTAEPYVGKSIRRWIGNGMGKWSGWCMSWAAQLHTALGNADMAQLIIENWRRVFTNEGHGTLHDCDFQGFTLLGAGETRPEIMQMDAGMGITSAILDCFVQSRRGVVHLFAGIPQSWGSVSFENIHTEDGFVVSGKRDGNGVSVVHVRSSRSGDMRLADPWALGQVRAIHLEANDEQVIVPPTIQRDGVAPG